MYLSVINVTKKVLIISYFVPLSLCSTLTLPLSVVLHLFIFVIDLFPFGELLGCFEPTTFLFFTSVCLRISSFLHHLPLYISVFSCSSLPFGLHHIFSLSLRLGSFGVVYSKQVCFVIHYYILFLFLLLLFLANYFIQSLSASIAIVDLFL